MKDLICTVCGKKIINGVSDESAEILGAGYCNDQSCTGKLEWVDHT